MLQYKNVWGGGNDPVPSIRNDFEYVKCTRGGKEPRASGALRCLR